MSFSSILNYRERVYQTMHVQRPLFIETSRHIHMSISKRNRVLIISRYRCPTYSRQAEERFGSWHGFEQITQSDKTKFLYIIYT